MHVGYDSKDLINDADLIIAIESDVPYMPNLVRPNRNCRITTIGVDPVYARYPMRNFPSNLTITATSTSALEALERALANAAIPEVRITKRRARIEAYRQKPSEYLAKSSVAKGDCISQAYLSKTIAATVGDDAVIFNEYSLMQDHCPRELPDTYYGLGSAGGLGWGMGAALGAKLTAPNKLILATLGDGVYMFSNPTAAHWFAEVNKAPIMSVIFNNSRYGAVRRATMSMFKDGAAELDGGRFMSDVNPRPSFHLAMQAQGYHGECVERAADLPVALARARCSARGSPGARKCYLSRLNYDARKKLSQMGANE